MFSPVLVDKDVTFAADVAAGNCFCWSRCPFDVISDSEIWFDISFSVSPGHVEKDPIIDCLEQGAFVKTAEDLMVKNF